MNPNPSTPSAETPLEDICDESTGMTPREAAMLLEEFPIISAEEILDTEWCSAVSVGQAEKCPQKVTKTLYNFHASRSARMAEQLAEAQKRIAELEAGNG